jgi:molybdenum ABC transporter molybdate-binding protein
MSDADDDWMREWKVGVRLWVERRGNAVLGPGRLELLEAIDRCGSISAAARDLRMSYRRAWLLIDRINRAAGIALVRSRTGGTEGGGAELTAEGRRAIAAFRELQVRVQQRAAERCPASPSPSLTGPIHVAAAASLEDVFHLILLDFAARYPDVSVRTIHGASDELAGHVLNGVHVDLFLSAEDRQLDRLAEAGLLRPQGRLSLAANRLAAIGRTTNPLSLRGPRELLQCPPRRLALAEPDCPLGHYSRCFLEPLQLWQPLRTHALFLDNPRVVLAAVESGEADVGLVYRSDALAARRCRILFTSPANRPPIRYSVALTRCGEQSAPARCLLAFLNSRLARRRLRAAGFTRPTSGG